MERLKSVECFYSLKKRLLSSLTRQFPTLIIPAGTCGQASGANDLIRIAKRELLTKKYLDKINLRITGCHGFCQMEPSVLIEPDRTFYPNVEYKDIPRIIEAAVHGDSVRELLFIDPQTGENIPKQDEIPFFKGQNRKILSGNEKVDPIRIYTYFENEGYSALAKIIEEDDPRWVLNEVKASGLRGRGGAGFPTGRKWEFLAEQTRSEKYLVCNADEGDPGAYMDRSVLEGNPHSIIEGMLIGAFATGATEGVIYVRNEYPLAIKHLIIALRQADDLGLLGEDILGTGFSFNIRIVRGAGAFVCGEETALIASIEGQMGEPRQRPPYPVKKGIYGSPTIINNVETLANIPNIILNGAHQYAKSGTEGNSGTKIFSLVGKSKHTGLVEVPLGVTIREIVYDLGGGPVSEAKIKAVQTGGPSGGCIPASLFDLCVDYDSLSKAGAIMGSGGMIVMDENTCMVDVAKYFMNFLKAESCGKCFSCRKGTQRMFEILDDICTGKGTLDHIELLEELALVVKDTTMCGLGQTAPNPVLSALRYFKDEFREHILKKRCRAFVCHDLVGPPCQSACPLGTEAWRYIALAEQGDYDGAYLAIRETNPFPSVCARVCNHSCESRCRAGTTGMQPIAIRALKRFVTDSVDPSVYQPRLKDSGDLTGKCVAIVGAGPAGLAATHALSLRGAKVAVFEAEKEPGGMLISGIPAYRLPRKVIRKEIQALLDSNVTLHCGKTLGNDFTLDDLQKDGFDAVFLAMGAHRSRRIHIDAEDTNGVYTAMPFLKTFNLEGINLAIGQVAVIGGGNSAIDAARVAVRQEAVDSVTILYRRTRAEMPAFDEEIEEALREGVKLIPLVTPIRIIERNGKVVGIECIRNELGAFDASGRRRPDPLTGSEHIFDVDTVIVAIGETPDTDMLLEFDVEADRDGRLHADSETYETSRTGVFAGGDVVTGPNTVVDALAAGSKAALMIAQFLKGEKPLPMYRATLPSTFIKPGEYSKEEKVHSKRVQIPTLPLEKRNSFNEVEETLSENDAIREARRCLRCDLEFFEKQEEPEETVSVGSESA